jgi:1,4-dihydroxy-6-naphthoate synthase
LTARLRVAISPCPNDLFIFGGWILGLRPWTRDFSFVFKDVQELNCEAEDFGYDLIKLSAVQALRLRHRWQVLSAGGAFSLGHGPKLVVRQGRSRPRRIAVPGLDTTAFLLLRAAADWEFDPVPTRYDRIIGAVVRGEAEGGLLIHESALVFRSHGVEMLLDLGEWWSEETGGLPLPLGVIALRESIAEQLGGELSEQIRASLRLAQRDPAPVWPLVRAMAQETDDRVIEAHIKAYVNRLSEDFGEQGSEGLKLLHALLAKNGFSERTVLQKGTPFPRS